MRLIFLTLGMLFSSLSWGESFCAKAYLRKAKEIERSMVLKQLNRTTTMTYFAGGVTGVLAPLAPLTAPLFLIGGTTMAISMIQSEKMANYYLVATILDQAAAGGGDYIDYFLEAVKKKADSADKASVIATIVQLDQENILCRYRSKEDEDGEEISYLSPTSDPNGLLKKVISILNEE
jgi:hypothetical protein